MSAGRSESARLPLLHAISIEARNRAIYGSLAQLFEGYEDSVTAIFREMAAEEEQHGVELERRYRERFGPVPSQADEPEEVVEAVDLDDSEAFIFDSMQIEQALEAGLRAEETAREFYRSQVGQTSDPELQKVYQELGEFEENHVRLLKEKLAAIRRRSDSLSR